MSANTKFMLARTFHSHRIVMLVSSRPIRQSFWGSTRQKRKHWHSSHLPHCTCDRTLHWQAHTYTTENAEQTNILQEHFERFYRDTAKIIYIIDLAKPSKLDASRRCSCNRQRCVEKYRRNKNGELKKTPCGRCHSFRTIVRRRLS